MNADWCTFETFLDSIHVHLDGGCWGAGAQPVLADQASTVQAVLVQRAGQAPASLVALYEDEADSRPKLVAEAGFTRKRGPRRDGHDADSTRNSSVSFVCHNILVTRGEMPACGVLFSRCCVLNHLIQI